MWGRILLVVLGMGVIGAVDLTAVADRGGDVARRGCCSHHDGVCGCSGGRAKCCDGTLSPTCGCD